MKKNQLKRSFIIGILFFSISLILSNCNKEDQTIVDESQLEKTTPLILNQKIPFNQAQHFNQLESKINKIKDKINGHNSQNKTGNEDIIILTDEVLYITYASTHTYSFKILREQPQAFIENIVLHYNIETEDYNEYLVQYHIPAEQFVSIHEGDLLQNSDNVTITSLENGFFENNSQAKSCNRVCVTITTACGGPDHHAFGNIGCPLIGTDMEASTYQSCSSVCDNDNEITAPDGNSGGESTGGGNTTVVSNPLPTEPCESDTIGGIGITGSNGECVTLVQINTDPSFDNYPCQKDIVESIYNNKSELSNFIVSAFSGDQNKVNLTYKMGKPKDKDGNNVDGNMNPDYDSNANTLDAVITIDSTMAKNATDLYIATITIHENLHAVLAYAVLINNLTTSPDPNLYELAITYAEWRTQNDPNTDEHAFMATMVSEIAKSLQEYGQSKGYDLSPDYYNDLSWSGEIGFNNDTFIGLPYEKKVAIRNALDNERNKAETDGKGEKCN